MKIERSAFDFSLEKSEIIVDGNNLRYDLYRECPGTNHAFGGDYEKVIELIVLMRGGFNM